MLARDFKEKRVGKACKKNSFTLYNHPSGDPSPSSEDIAITRRLKEAGDLLGSKLMNHVTVGVDGVLSLIVRRVM